MNSKEAITFGRNFFPLVIMLGWPFAQFYSCVVIICDYNYWAIQLICLISFFRPGLYSDDFFMIAFSGMLFIMTYIPALLVCVVICGNLHITVSVNHSVTAYFISYILHSHLSDKKRISSDDQLVG